MRMPRLAATAVALTLMTGACGDSTGPQVELSDAEIEVLFEAIADALAEAGAGFSFHEAADLGAARLPGLFLSSSSMPPVSFSATADCAQGGSVSVSGSGNSDDTSFDFSIRETFNNCQTESGFTVDGQIDLNGDGSSSQNGGSINLDVEGNLTVETDDGRTGSCRLDYGYDLTSTGTSFSFSIHGTICGRNIEDIIGQGDL